MSSFRRRLMLTENKKAEPPITNGIYILRTDNKLYTKDEWDTSWNSESVGVAVISNRAKFVVCKKDLANKVWGSDVLVDGVYASTDILDARRSDYKGKDNTDKILEQLGENVALAANSCAKYTFLNGSKGYLPSIGEWNVVEGYREEIEEYLTLIKGSLFSRTLQYWSSTQYNDSKAHVIRIDSDIYGNALFSSYFKIMGAAVRPFAPLDI